MLLVRGRSARRESAAVQGQILRHVVILAGSLAHLAIQVLSDVVTQAESRVRYARLATSRVPHDHRAISQAAAAVVGLQLRGSPAARAANHLLSHLPQLGIWYLATETASSTNSSIWT